MDNARLKPQSSLIAPSTAVKMLRYVFVSTGLLVLLVSPCKSLARPVQNWTYQQMKEKADLVVIAIPTASKVTTERTTLTDLNPGVAVSGVETTFRVLTVFDGDKEVKEFTLHHYTLTNPQERMVNGPLLFEFIPIAKYQPAYLLFLIKEADGRYAPVSGQTDPMTFSIIEMKGGPQPDLSSLHVQEYPYAIPVPGKPGYVISPYAATKPPVNVMRLPPGTEVKCPYTGKNFLVP